MSDRHPLQPFYNKLAKLAPLDADDRSALANLSHRLASARPGEHIIRQGKSTDSCYALLEGYAYRARSTVDGRLQILSFHVPGDLFELGGVLGDRPQWDVVTLGKASVASIALNTIRQLRDERANIANALWEDLRLNSAIFAEWVVNIGQRDAYQRVAHMIAEFAHRRSVALGEATRFLMPMTQQQIGAAAGITAVHANRIIQHLRRAGALGHQSGRILVDDTEMLARIAQFEPAYMQPLTRNRT